MNNIQDATLQTKAMQAELDAMKFAKASSYLPVIDTTSLVCIC